MYRIWRCRHGFSSWNRHDSQILWQAVWWHSKFLHGILSNSHRWRTNRHDSTDYQGKCFGIITRHNKNTNCDLTTHWMHAIVSKRGKTWLILQTFCVKLSISHVITNVLASFDNWWQLAICHSEIARMLSMNVSPTIVVSWKLLGFCSPSTCKILWVASWSKHWIWLTNTGWPWASIIPQNYARLFHGITHNYIRQFRPKGQFRSHMNYRSIQSLQKELSCHPNHPNHPNHPSAV